MSLATGTRLGAYEIVGSIGAGGMGEVYRARDPRLGRDVAIKVLPASFAEDPDRVRRFEKEARAAGALNHPNLVTVFDVGSHDGGPFLVLELLEGSTLKALLEGKPLPVRKAVDYAVQIAVGLSAAHEGGIVHRDLKPANLFVTRDGRVKILDFGLAKSERPLVGEGVGSEALTASRGTESRVILGTVGYISPEQVVGKAADARSDIFSFGAVLYEMLSGRRAFRGATTVDTLSAILNQDPPELARSDEPVPPTLERIVRRCLEKDPSRRFRTAHDLAFALEALSGSRPISGIGAAAKSAPRWWKPGVAIALLLGGLALLGGGYLAGSRRETTLPSFHRLTFRHGHVTGARFAPDGKTIVYSAAWDGLPEELYSARVESSESRALGVTKARLYSVSATAELAINRGSPGSEYLLQGTLAQVPLGGGDPRPLEEKVTAADWAPDGKRLAVVRMGGLEFPPGKLVYQSSDRVIADVRISPLGDRLAILETGDDENGQASVAITDLQGKILVTTRRWKTGMGLAWTPKGDEVWFCASDVGMAFALHAVSLAGKVRRVASIPGAVVIRDISPDGRVLLTHDTIRRGVAGLFPGGTQERDLSWFDRSDLWDISADGGTILFNEKGEGAGAQDVVYLRKTDGSAPIRLGEGIGKALSPDGRWVAGLPPGSDATKILLLPTGSGEPRTLSLSPLQVNDPTWFPDGKRLAVTAGGRCQAVDVETGKSSPMTPEGFACGWSGPAVSPDAKSLLLWDARDESVRRFPMAIRPIAGETTRRLVGAPLSSSWSADSQALLGFRSEGGDTQRVRFDIATGAVQALGRISLADRTASLTGLNSTPDGKWYVYQYDQTLNDLYLADGLR